MTECYANVPDDWSWAVSSLRHAIHEFVDGEGVQIRKHLLTYQRGSEECNSPDEF